MGFGQFERKPLFIIRSKIVIFESLLSTLEATNIFETSVGVERKWLDHKTILP